jgi:hypothetical protein
MKSLVLSLAILVAPIVSAPTSQPQLASIPSAKGTALDGRSISLPQDLPGRASILILGFDRNSAGPTTAWEKPIRAQLASPPATTGFPAIGYLDMPFLEDAPAFIRPLILHSIRNQVPAVLKPNFVPLTSGEAVWKQLTHFSTATPDAAYVLLVDRNGQVRWQTHEPFTPALFQELSTAAHNLAAEPS